MKLWHVPLRAATGAFILNSGLGKRTVEPDRAAALQAGAVTVLPQLWSVDPPAFARLLSRFEIVLGSALLLPFVPSGLAGAALTAFSGGLLRMYLARPELRLPGSVRPSAQGTAIAKDVWMFGIGLALTIDAIGSRSSG